MKHISSEADWYVKQASKTKLLSKAEEIEITKAFKRTGDQRYADHLARANLLFVVKMVHSYHGYGMNFMDLIQEGNVGLLRAIQKFDPDKGYRFITYAVWWIRAALGNYVIKNWSLVKLGTTVGQRKLFYGLKKAKAKYEKSLVSHDYDVEELALILGVTSKEYLEMEIRTAGRDFSLDADGGKEGEGPLLDLLEGGCENPEEVYEEKERKEILYANVYAVWPKLNEKERAVLKDRLLSPDPRTLLDIGKNFGLSRERIRQIQASVYLKLKSALVESGFETAA